MEIYLVHAMHFLPENEELDNRFILSAHETEEGAKEQMRLMREADKHTMPNNWQEWKYMYERITLMK